MNRIEKDEDEYDDDGNLIIQVDRQTDADRQIEKDTDKQTNRQTDEEIDAVLKITIFFILPRVPSLMPKNCRVWECPSAQPAKQTAILPPRRLQTFRRGCRVTLKVTIL